MKSINKFLLEGLPGKHVCSILLILLVLSILSLLSSCASKQKKSNTPTAFQSKPVSQVGPVNNSRYFGKQFDDQTPVEEVIAEGRSEILASGEQAAYDAALEHALRNAVEIVLGTMIDNRTMVNRGVLIEDKIFSRAYGYVKTYQVLEERNQAKTKYLKVKAAVVVGDVRDDAMALGILQDRVQRPIIVVLVDEKDLEGRGSSFFKTALEEKLLDKQFEIIHQEQMARVLKKINSSLADIAVNNEKAIDAGIESGAQIIIKAKVDAVPNDLSKNPLFKNKNLKSVNVSVGVEGYNVGDARLLSVRQMRENGIGLDDVTALKNALEKMVDKLGDGLIDDFLKKWDLYVNNGFEYSVTISGVDFDETSIIKNNIPKRIQGIKAVFDKGYENRIMNLLIRYQGPADELVRFLKIKLIPEVNLELQSYDQNKIILYAK